MLYGDFYCHKVDVWSAGITMFILLFNKMPFSDKTPERTFLKILTTDLPEEKDPVWKTVSPEAQHLLRQLLTKEPEYRMHSSVVQDHPWFTGEPLVQLNDSKLI